MVRLIRRVSPFVGLNMDIAGRKIVAYIFISAAVSSMLFGYEILRNVSSSLVRFDFGIESYTASLALVPLLAVLLLFIYNKVLSLFGPSKTLYISLGFSLAVISFMYLLLIGGYSKVSFLLNIFCDAFIVLIMEQYWSYLNSISKQTEAKKIYGWISAVASIGPAMGGLLVYRVSQSLGTVQLIVFVLAAFIPSFFFTYFAFKAWPLPLSLKQEKRNEVTVGMGLREFKVSPILRTIMLVVVSSQAFSTLVLIGFQLELKSSFDSMDLQTSYSGLFYSCTHGVTLFAQIFLSPLVFKYFCVKQVFKFIPLVHFILAIFAVVVPGLTSMSVCLLVFKALDYSLFRVSKETLYIPLSSDARFRTKELIDVLGYRSSKGVTSLLVTAGHGFGWLLSASSMMVLGASLAATWWISVLSVTRKANFNKLFSKSGASNGFE